jgi:hypothetical protein
MISWCTSSIPKEDGVFPRLLNCDSRGSQTYHQRSQAFPGVSSALPGALWHTESSLWRSEVLPNLTPSLPLYACTSHHISQLLWRPAGMPSPNLILSWNWRISVYPPHPVTHSWSLPVTKIHFTVIVSHISESIRQMDSCDNVPTDLSEQLHIANVNEAYWSRNKVNYILQMLKHNDRCTGLDYTEETLSYLALQGWYNIDFAKVFNLLSTTDKWQTTYTTHLLRLQIIEDEPYICPVLQQLYHLREIHICGVCRRFKWTLLGDPSEDFRISNFGKLRWAQIEEECGHKVHGLVVG